ncbi:MAG: aldose 1-epimerase family protein [Ruminococcus sp.]|nr:aldose 1-epimerase family protein [Ruminococcus sp.]
MINTITNGKLAVSADTAGAELHSIKMNDTEYLWQCGDAWKRYAPILFPFICSPKDKKYKAGGREYTMPSNHGFARDSEFVLAASSETSLTYKQTSSEDTLKVYPYSFELYVTYSLDGDTVIETNKVVNTDDKPMYFYLGGHPAFNCPLEEGLSFDDYYVEYEKPETIVQVWNGTRTIIENESKLYLTRALFDNDVVMKDAPDSKKVTLKTDKNSKGVELSFPDSNCIAVWSPTGNDEAKFVCLEPWTSVPVYDDDTFKDIEKKPHAIKLEPGKEYTYTYRMRVF